MTERNSDWAIQTRNLSKRYQDAKAVDNLDLSVPKNSIFAFLGPNGAGKSTTVRLLLGLIRPTGGDGTVLGFDIVRESLEIRKRVGYLAQDYRFYRRLTVEKTLDFVVRFFYRGPERLIGRRIRESLELVGLEDKSECPVGELSGGERQRLGIAQAQINHPELLILDEPTASLDPMGRKAVLEVMERLREHTTILYSTHILSDVERVSDTVAILDRGRLVTQAGIRELLEKSGGIVYSLTVKGAPRMLLALLSELPWVLSVETTAANDETTVKIQVTDEKQAEAQLFRTALVDESLVVTRFGRESATLEDIFSELVGGDESER